MKKGKIKTY